MTTCYLHKQNTFRQQRSLILYFVLLILLGGLGARAQVSSNVTITPQSTPSLTPCSGQGTFVVRVANVTVNPIANLTFRDSMPPGINYVAGSVSGTGVTFGSTVIASNVVTFNIASLPANGFVDITFLVAVNCSVSTVTTNMKNTYRVNWGTFSTNPFVTPTYSMGFPSLSISVDSPLVIALCRTPFVRKITICNGGFGAVDSVTLSDVEQASLRVMGFSMGTVTGAGTSNAKTVLKAADFMTVGNSDGKFDQGECIVVYDTQKVIGSTSPINGTLRADWGCGGTTCTNPNGNSIAITTNISSASTSPQLTRTLLPQIGTDSSGHIFNRTTTYKEAIVNNSQATAENVSLVYFAMGLKYINTGSITVSKNGGTPYVPVYGNYPSGSGSGGPLGNPTGSMGNVVAPTPFTGGNLPNGVSVSLGDIDPGDSLVVTFTTTTAGPVTRVNNAAGGTNTGSNTFCGSFYRYHDGPAIGTAMNARLLWQGCPSGSYSQCRADFQGTIYNGIANVSEPAGIAPLYLARFRNYSFIDSSALLNPDTTGCGTIVYKDLDTVKLYMTAGVMDIPFYTTKSKLAIKIYTKGGIKWSGNLNQVYCHLSTWSNARWQADQVVDNTNTDSTITVYFKHADCPVLSNFAADAYNSYRGGVFRLNMHFINTCPGQVDKELYMTRIYTIDSASADPPVEAGPTVPVFSWESKCAPLCADGVIIEDYSHVRITLGQPDNNSDGIADTSGSLNMTAINTSRITWGDTFRLKFKMIVHTTQAGGVPYLYLNSAVAGQSAAANTECNNFLKKTVPQVKLIRPGTGTFMAMGGTEPVSTGSSYLANLSLEGAGALNIPGITAYQDGDTVEVTEDLVYWTPHITFNGPFIWNFVHVPYTSMVPDPAVAQQFRCDSIYNCPTFQTVDIFLSQASSTVGTSGLCSDTLVLRAGIYADARVGCGTAPFPFEARNIVTPNVMKLVINGGWSLNSGNVRVNWNWKKNGTASCANAINNQVLPSGQYTQSGDTLIFDLVQIGNFYGQNIEINQMRSYFYFDIPLKYTPTAAQQGCVRDHSALSKTFPIICDFKAVRPMDTTQLVNVAYATNTVGLNWPGANNNTVALPVINTITVTQSSVTIPLRYGNTNAYGNDFLAIPDVAGIAVDSVKDNITGAVIVPSGNIYNLSYLPTGNRDFNVYTRVTLCNNGTLRFYADRTPCSGIPASWAAYACKANASQVGFNYITTDGELQMTDSLYTTQKDLCTSDTVEFKVVNSQTQDATNVKISFTLPQHMLLIPGQTQLKMGDGALVTVADPILTAGVYSWTLTSDTLYRVSQAPNNKLSLRVGIITECGYASGSQITSSIAGNVACGPVTSLFNTNPPPLTINNVPLPAYTTNIQASAQQVTGCSPDTSYDYRVALHIGNSLTVAGDDITVTLPPEYTYVSYNASAPGSSHAPAGAPTSTLLPDGSTYLVWNMPAGIPIGDSIVFTFRYNERSTQVNKCSTDPSRQSVVRTLANATAFCTSTNTNCGVSTSIGMDTVNLQSFKPAVFNSVSAATYGDALNAVIPGVQSYISVQGTLANNGSAALPSGTPVYMEVFIDADSSGSVTSGDFALDPLVYNDGLGIGGSYNYTYADTFDPALCPTCPGKSLLFRFSNNPTVAGSPGASQCLCDSVTASLTTPNTEPLALYLGEFRGMAQGCDKALLNWNTYEETGKGLFFEIQQSTDGSSFNRVSTVPANGLASNYEQVVSMPARKVYYRLVLHEDASYVYSKIVTVVSDCWSHSGRSITAYPNPFSDVINIKGAEQGSEIILMDVAGRRLYRQAAGGSGTDVLSIKGLAGGSYILTITGPMGQVTHIKVAKE